MRITYKLVLDNEGAITEEVFENGEDMLARAKVLTEPEKPAVDEPKAPEVEPEVAEPAVVPPVEEKPAV
mgnify:CR=1 FL=1